MPYPSGLPVDEQILDALKTRLATITTPAYHTRVKRVERFKVNNTFAVQEFPAIIIGAAEFEWEQAVSVRVGGNLKVTVRAVLEDRETHQTSLAWLSADIRKAILSDVQLGGVACWTRVVSEERYLLVDEASATPALDIGLLIHFRHLTDDPNTTA
jgi:hypothetical protein